MTDCNYAQCTLNERCHLIEHSTIWASYQTFDKRLYCVKRGKIHKMKHQQVLLALTLLPTHLPYFYTQQQYLC